MTLLFMNVIIQTLILGSFVFETGFGLSAPFFAVFVSRQIPGADLAVLGYASGIYWILKSLLQIPIGAWLDRTKGEQDDFWTLIAGHFIMGAVLFLYIFVTTPMELYLLQILLAIGGALAVPPWFAMFIRHVDQLKEGYEWSINSSLSFGVGTGVAGIVGGLLAQHYGFEITFILGGVLVWAGTIFFFVLRRHLAGAKRVSVPKLPYPL